MDEVAPLRPIIDPASFDDERLAAALVGPLLPASPRVRRLKDADASSSDATNTSSSSEDPICHSSSAPV